MQVEPIAIAAEDLLLAGMAFCRRPIPDGRGMPDITRLTYADLLAETYEWARVPEPDVADEEDDRVPLVGVGEIAWEERLL